MTAMAGVQLSRRLALASSPSLCRPRSRQCRGLSDLREDGKVTGPRYYPSLSQTLRNTRGRELLRIVDTAVPNLQSEQEFLVILKALALDGQFRRALRLMREMKDLGLELDIVKYNWVLSAMAKDKQVERALAMLEEMREATVSPDLQSYNHCAGACKPKEWQESLHILRTLMPAAGVEADAQSFEHVAAACEEAHEWQRSLSLFLEIGEQGLFASSVGHNYALSACRQGKQWKHGLEIMDTMKQRSFEPDFRLKMDLEAQSRGLERAPPPEPSSRSMPSPDNVWQRKQQLRELREQDKRRQEERRLEEERQKRLRDAHSTPAEASKEKTESLKKTQERKPEPEPAAPAAPAPANVASPKAKATTERSGATGEAAAPDAQAQSRKVEAEVSREERCPKERDRRESPTPRRDPKRPKLRSPGSYVLPVFAQHDRSNHAERQALIKVIARVQEASGAKTDAEFEAECAEVTGTVRLYASHTPCISCMACFCQFQRLFPKVKLCVDFDDWRDTRRMVEMARREEEHKKRGSTPPDYDCAGLSDMSDEEEPDCLETMPQAGSVASAAP